MLPHLSFSQITDLANLASDAASRGKFEALHSLARQLGVVAVEVQVPNAALDLFHNAVRELEKLQEKCPYTEPDNHHILNFGNPLKSCGAVLGSGLALLCIVVMIGIVAEDCEALTMPTVDHAPTP